MAINKVVFGDSVLMDISEDTVTKESLLEGFTAHDRSGQQISGTAKTGGKQYTVNLLAKSWTEEADGTYQQKVSISGINSGTRLYLCGAEVAGVSESEKIRDLSIAMGRINQITTGDGYAIFICLFDLPEIDIENLIVSEI